MSQMEMLLMSALRTLQFRMIYLHNFALSGTAPAGPLPF